MTNEQLLALMAAIFRAQGFLPANAVAAARDTWQRVTVGGPDGRLWNELTDEEIAARETSE